mmetsp:Transcript_27916/g.67919  ORF Transcript_27916/g.67919 Transcript_27916/m.67919 type:complete len:333 (-) Transcript_27916:287-1285(-)
MTITATTTNTNNTTIPIIYLNDPDEASTVAKLRQCCLEHGFFYLGGHEMEDIFPKMFALSKRLFELPLAEKLRLKDKKMSRGYAALGSETLDPILSKQGDSKEGFYIGNHIPPNDPRYDPAKLKGPNVWPSNENCSLSDSKQFVDTMREYHARASAVGLKVIQLLALAVGLPNQHDLDHNFKENWATLRLLHYAAVQSQPQEGLFACGAHSDYGMITLLLTDENPGLQILTASSKEWVDVPPKKDLFVVNLGDMLERWTNGLFRSTMHRVVTTSQKERYSMPFFFEPDFDAQVACLPVCCSEENPPKYPPTTAGQHILDKYNQTREDFQSSD